MPAQAPPVGDESYQAAVWSVAISAAAGSALPADAAAKVSSWLQNEASSTIGAAFELVRDCPLRVHCIAALQYGVTQQYKRRVREQLVNFCFSEVASVRCSSTILEGECRDAIRAWWLVSALDSHDNVPTACLSSYHRSASAPNSYSSQPFAP
eukprot:m.102490 g.102490  ORF g.102490 m.102490 type:complete len:153 (+) comp15190_c0_seq62:2417-2875(+)